MLRYEKLRNKYKQCRIYRFSSSAAGGRVLIALLALAMVLTMSAAGSAEQTPGAGSKSSVNSTSGSLQLTSAPVYSEDLLRPHIKAQVKVIAASGIEELRISNHHERHYQSLEKRATLAHLSFDQDVTEYRIEGARQVSGIIGTALRFDGQDDRVVLATDDAPELSGSFSIAAWVRREGTGTAPHDRYIVARQKTAQESFILASNVTGELYFSICDADNICYTAKGGPLPLDTWTHVAAVVDRSRQQLQLYSNGELVAELQGPAATTSSALPLTVGAAADKRFGWQGLIDEVKVHADALAAREINQLYLNASQDFAYYDHSLVALLTFDELQPEIVGHSRRQQKVYVNGGVLVSGRLGSAMQLDGENDMVIIEERQADWFAESFSIEAWLNLSETTSSDLPRCIVASAVDGDIAGMALLMTPGGELALSVAGVDADEEAIRWFGVTGDAPPAQVWTHVVGVYDKPAQRLRLYQNGRLVAEAEGPVEMLRSALPVTIGASYGNQHNLHGTIDEVRIYQRSLGSVEVQFHAAAAMISEGQTGWLLEVELPVLSSGLYSLGIEMIDGQGRHHSLRSQTVEAVLQEPSFSVLVIGDPHVQSDLVRLREPHYSLESVLRDSVEGGDQGGGPIPWDIVVITGDYTGRQTCPSDEKGAEILAQITAAGVDPNRIYGVIGNHDADTGYQFFQRWIDPLGVNTEYSGVLNSQRPFPVSGVWDHYQFRVGNLLFLMLGDRNAPEDPYGRDCSVGQSGFPAGAVTADTYIWWKAMVENHQSSNIISVFHHALLETTTGTSFGEGIENNHHAASTWADERGSSMLYAIANWTIDGFNNTGEYLGERPIGFVQYLEQHPGAISLWLHGHTHYHTHPGMRLAGKSLLESKHGVAFLNSGAVSKAHGPAAVPFSRVLCFYQGSDQLLVKTYLHEAGWRGRSEGFYDHASYAIELKHPFSAGGEHLP